MKALRKKKKRIQEQALKIQDSAHSLLFGIVITPADAHPQISFSAKALRFVGDAVGDKVIVWHKKYLDKFTKLVDECYAEYVQMIEDAKIEKFQDEKEEQRLGTEEEQPSGE